jgi:hypothetical protein
VRFTAISNTLCLHSLPDRLKGQAHQLGRVSQRRLILESYGREGDDEAVCIIRGECRRGAGTHREKHAMTAPRCKVLFRFLGRRKSPSGAPGGHRDAEAGAVAGSILMMTGHYSNSVTRQVARRFFLTGM